MHHYDTALAPPLKAGIVRQAKEALMKQSKHAIILEARGFTPTGRRLDLVEPESIEPFVIDIKTGIHDADAYTFAVDETGALWRADHLISMDDTAFAKPFKDELVDMLSEILKKVHGRTIR